MQAAALEQIGHDVRLIMGNDPPGQFTRVLHPRVGRHGEPPANVIPVGRSVIVPANGSLPNIVLSPRTFGRMRRTLERERFDVLHLHEPMTPVICTATLVDRANADGGNLPRVGRPRVDEARNARLGIPARASGLPDRRLRARTHVAGALAAGRVRRHPERRARAGIGPGRRAGASRRLRRPPGAAKGPAGAPRCVARDPPALGSATHRGGSGSARGAPAPHPAPRQRRRHRRRRLPESGRR